MADVFTKEKRSAVMSKIKGKGTKPELMVMDHLEKKGYVFRRNVPDMPGKPDVVMDRHMIVVRVNGCMWHDHSCRKGKRPKSNVEFWDKKVTGNKVRDKKHGDALRRKGWKVITVWECELSTIKKREVTLRNLVGKIREIRRCRR
jgi:DNA mismatch endonuclease (patch repair protein)